MNARLLVLGVLHRGPFHPYEIKRRLKAALVECYMDVDVGTLYYAVRQLEKEGLIQAVRDERVSRGGVRTIYQITSEGRAEFRQSLSHELETEGPVSKTLYGALLFLHLADPAIVKNALQRKLARLIELTAEVESVRQQLAPVLSTGTRHLLAHIDRQRQLDRSWIEDLLADIEANGILDVPDPARLEAH